MYDYKSRTEYEYRAKDALKILEKRSEDPHTQVACIITDSNGYLVSTGVNSMPYRSIGLPWNREGNYLETKYPYVVHAEMNAIINLSENYYCFPEKAFITLFPCVNCLKLLLQAGVTEIIYTKKSYPDKDFIKAAEILVENTGIICREVTDDDLIRSNYKLSS